MKKIEAIIHQDRLEPVGKSLEEFGYPGVTITDVRGHGIRQSKNVSGESDSHSSAAVARVKLEVVVEDRDAEKIISAVLATAKQENRETGSGKIFVLPVESAIRIRTAERGEAALYSGKK